MKIQKGMKIPNEVVELVVHITYLESKRDKCLSTIKDLVAAIEVLNIKIKSIGV